MARYTSDASLFPLVWLIYSTLSDYQHGVQATSLLETSSFETIMSIRHYRPGQNYDIRVEEKYSHDQQRLLFKVKGSRSWNWWQEGHRKSALEDSTVFYDAKSGVSLKYHIGGCQHFNSNELLASLGLNILPDDEFTANLPKHIVGASSWIYYIANQRRNLKLILAEGKQFVSNIRSVSYSMTLTDRLGKQVQLRVYYSEASLTGANHEDSLPNLIVFDHEDKSITFINVLLVRFHSKSSFASPHPYSDAANMPSLFEPELDAFILPPTTGCSALLGESNRKTIFELRHNSTGVDLPPPARRRFSFKAHVQHDRELNGGRKFSVYVAYDHDLETMRADVSAPPYTSPPTTQIFNFYSNRMYHVLDQATINGNYPIQAVVGANESLGQRRAAPLPQISAKTTGPKCASATIHSTSTWERYSYGHLLWGADTFAYLGQARVRGIRASVYEAVESKLPYWLEQPIDYCDTRGIYKTRPTLGSLLDQSPPAERLVTLVYLSDEGDAAAGEDKLLLMEIYRMNLEYTVVHDKRTVTVQDFSWYLVPLSPIQSPLAAQVSPSDLSKPSAWELFSLAESCGADVSAEEGNEHARLEMLLESQSQVESNAQTSARLLLTTNPTARNLAILGALQKNFNAIMTMIYDLQSRPMKSQAGHDGVGQDAARLQILVAFNVARHSKVTHDVHYLGRGNRVLGSSWFFHLPTFAHCFALASHRPAEVHFAYDPDTNNCYIATRSAQQINGEIIGDADGHKGVAFELDESGSLEIYWTRKVNDYQGIVERIADMVDVHSKRRLRMLDRVLMLEAGQVAPVADANPIQMAIKRLDVRQDKPHGVSASDANLGRDSSADFVDKIDGFGLVERADLVETAQLPRLNDDVRPIELTTFGQCQSICSTDSACKSFSFCVQGAQVECLTSRLSLSSPALVAGLLSAAKPQSGRYELKVADDGAETGATVQLRKHLNCAIHNKRYTKYFDIVFKVKMISLFNRRVVRAAGGAEECARICFQQNVHLLAGQHQTLADLHGREGALDGLTRLSRDLGDKGCLAFYYIDYAQVPTEMLDKWNQMAGLNDHHRDQEHSETGPKSAVTTAGGYCALQAFSPDRANQSHWLHFDSLLDVERYAFSEAEMFEQEYGTHLVGSELSEEELAAYREVVRHQRAAESGEDGGGGGGLGELDRNSLALVRAVLRRGDNIQLEVRGNRALCAGLCLTQMTGLWPACRSFDLVKIKYSDGTKLKCVFNTMSKHEAIASGRLDLIDSTTSSSQLERWHYEPRVAALGSSDESFELARGAEELNQLERTLHPASHLTMLVSVGLLSGLLVGIIAGLYLQRAAARRRRPSLDPMVATLGQDFPMSITQ